MNVVLAGYQAISILHGGPNTQLRNTAKHLSQFGVTGTIFRSVVTVRPRRVRSLSPLRRKCRHVSSCPGDSCAEPSACCLADCLQPSFSGLHPNAIRIGRLLQKPGLGLWTDYLFTADIVRWANAILPNSRAEGDLVAKGFGARPETISIVPNGVDERFGSADPTLFKKTYGLDRFILNVGHIGHGRKNVLNLIKALASIDHPAVIIGRIIRGPYGDACVREAAKHKHILLIDGLDNSSPMLASAYAACNVFALPSLFETPGIAALEAGLAGAKIVITPYGGTREYFGEMATYVEPDSVMGIRKGIEGAIDAKASGTLGEHIRRNYLWPRVAELTAAAYRALIGRS